MANKTCGAKTRKGSPCKNPALPNGRCRFHGGRSKKGINAPGFKHGRYSKYLPPKLGGKYSEFLENPELLQLREDIALMELRIGLLLRTLEEGGGGSVMWADAQKLYMDLVSAIRKQDSGRVSIVLKELGEVLESGVYTAETWKEITGFLEVKRRLVESERKKEEREATTLTLEELRVISGLIQYQITQAISTVIEDHELSRRLSNNIAKSLSQIIPG